MANIFESNYGKAPLHMSESGDKTGDARSITLASAAAIGDKIYIAKIPGGTKYTNSEILFGATVASATVSVGYDALEDRSVAASAVGFFAAGVPVTAGLVHSVTAPFITDGALGVYLTVAGAAITAGTKITFRWAGNAIGIR